MHHPVRADDLTVALRHAADALRRAERVAVLTGAGVSAESGVPTFRGADGLWEGYRVEEVATPTAFERDPKLVWRFYNSRRANVRRAEPIAGHRALVGMEDRWGSDRFTLVTQNVDGLHTRAGSRHVLELHGNLGRVRCTGCHAVTERGDDLPELPHCLICGALLRPDIVWFHEMLPPGVWEAAARATARCQCFLVVGTSTVVYPAAGLIDLARACGATVIEVNPEMTEAGAAGAIHLRGPAGVVLPRLVEEVGTEPEA
jgi:NAD-dependent deacetylase